MLAANLHIILCTVKKGEYILVKNGENTLFLPLNKRSMDSIRKIAKRAVSALGKRHPETVVRIRYFMRFHKVPNISAPKNLNEKIQFLSLRTDTREWTRLTDKYGAREYIHECGLDDILVPLLGKWDRAADIDFDKLPESFVIKATHGSGDCMIVKDKGKCDIEGMRSQIDATLHETYGLSEGNMHYSRIRPAVVAEKLLENDPASARYSESLIDYKIWCFNGKAHYIWVCTDRTKSSANVMTYDTDWNAHPEYSVFNSHYRRGAVIPKPVGLDRMLEVAEILARPFPVVRVDLYNLDGQVYFGEMTFTSLGGLMDFYTPQFLDHAGSLIELP